MPNLGSVLKDTFKDTLSLFKTAEISTAASSLAYTTILSIIPLLAVSFSVFKAFGGLDTLLGTLEPIIFENLAEGSDEKTLELIRSFIGNIHTGALGISGMIGLLITSMSMLNSVEKSINRIWKTAIPRSFFRRISGYWFFLTLGPLALSFVIGLATSLDVPLSKFLPSGIPFLFILLGIFYGIYRYVPHQKVSWKAALIGAIGTSLVWMMAKMAYGVYVKKVVTYDKIYGSLGAIPILLVWIYVAWLVVLTGAAFSCCLQSHLAPQESKS